MKTVSINRCATLIELIEGTLPPCISKMLHSEGSGVMHATSINHALHNHSL